MIINGYKEYKDKNQNSIFIADDTDMKQICSGKTQINLNGSNSVLFIAKGAKLDGCEIELGSGCVIFIAESLVQNAILRSYKDSVIYIGKNIFFNPLGLTELNAISRRHIIIGDGCFFSYPLVFDSGDFHMIYSFNGAHLNPAKSILIGDFVWLGRDINILKGSMIGSGAIIGAKSVVSGKIASNTISVGTPAKTIKKDVFWLGKTDASWSVLDSERAKHFSGLDNINNSLKLGEQMATEIASKQIQKRQFSFDKAQNIADLLMAVEFISEAEAAKLSFKNGWKDKRYIVIADSSEERLKWVMENIHNNKNKNRFAVDCGGGGE